LYDFSFGSHYFLICDIAEDQKAERANPSWGKNRLPDTIRTARDAIWWVLMQVVKLLRIITAAVQALFQTLLPEKIVARVDSAIRSARERLVTVVFRSALAAWAVLSCTISLIFNTPRITFLSRSLRKQ